MRNFVQFTFDKLGTNNVVSRKTNGLTALVRNLSVTLYVALALASCAQLGGKRTAAATPPVNVDAPVPAIATATAAAREAQIGAPAVEEGKSLFPGTGQFAKPGAPAEAQARPALADQEVSFNFEATPVPEVVKTILGDLLQETYVIGPGVGGTVTFSTAKPIKGEQAMAVLEMLLSWSGAALVRKGDAYLVVQTQAAVPGNLAPKLIAGDGRGYSVRAVPLKFISATQMEELLKPYAKQGSVLKADNARSLLVIAGTKSELDNYLSVIDTFDVDWMAGMSFGLFTLERVEVKDLMPELEGIFGDAGGGAAGAGSSPLAGMVRMLPVERLNAILVITPQPSYLGQVESWIKRLDRGGTEGGSKLYVYDVQNVKATDLADRLNEIFNGQAAAPRQERRTERGAVAPGLNGQNLGGNPFGGAGLTPPVAKPATPTPTAAAGAAGGTGKSLLGEQEVRITAVEDNNSLLISSTPAQYEILKSAIRRLDTEPMQVKIEAKLLEVSLSNSLKFGVQWWLEQAIPSPPMTTMTATSPSVPINNGPLGGVTSPVTLGLTSVNAGLRSFSGAGGVLTASGLSYIFNGRDARAFVTAMQNETDTKVLSSPTLMVLNNKEASITVGGQVRQSQGQILAGTIGQGAELATFVPIGITLTVTPRVNPGGLVYLEIDQQQSTKGTENTINTKQVTTEVAVQSGQTIFLGGLIQETNSNSNGGLPGLKNIPLIGRLFGGSEKTVDRTETLILITPTVVEGGSSKMREVTDEYVRRFKGLEPLIRDGAIPPAPLKSARPALRNGELLGTPEPTPAETMPAPAAATIPAAQPAPIPAQAIPPAPPVITPAPQL
jgi:general secretion pathway protein D